MENKPQLGRDHLHRMTENFCRLKAMANILRQHLT
jgi:hypothetical protein